MSKYNAVTNVHQDLSPAWCNNNSVWVIEWLYGNEVFGGRRWDASTQYQPGIKTSWCLIYEARTTATLFF